MIPFTHWFPAQRVVFGRGSAADLRAHLEATGVARPLLICSARGRESAPVAAWSAALPVGSLRIWDRAALHAPLEAAIDGAEAARVHGADGIVAFGGGSASDLAKGIALAVAEGPDLEPFALRRTQGAITGRQSLASKLPVIALPTTLSGAEITPGFSLTRADAYKLIFRDAALAARLVVLDPALLDGVPRAVLAGSAMNALAHCFEALYSGTRTPITSTLALDGLRRLWTGFDCFLEGGVGGVSAADELLVGAYLAGSAIVNARTALHHAICHKLAPLAGLSHGDANALVLPHALAFNLPACPAEAAAMAGAVGIATAGAASASTVAAIIARLGGAVVRAGLRTRLRDTDLDREQLPELAQRVFTEPGLAFNPRPIESSAAILALLEGAW
jgi:alcohol dehydrogenase